MMIKRTPLMHPDQAGFSVLAVDLAEYSFLFAEPMNVTFTGYHSDGSTVVQTFLLDGVMDGPGLVADFQTFQFNSGFTNLVLLEGSSGAWHMDNLVVTLQEGIRLTSDGLVSWWRAEGNTLDSWGTNHGSPTAKFEPGKVGQCFTAPSQTRIANAPSLQLTNALTIEAWVNPQPPSPAGVFRRSVVSKFDFAQFSQRGAGSYFLGLGHGNYPNGPVFMLTPSGFETNAIRLAPFTNLPSGQWSHLAATYDGATMRLYLNGILLAQSNYTGGIWPGTNDLGIGATPLTGLGRTYYPFNGRIDEVSIFRRALSGAEIADIHQADSTGKFFSACVDSPAGVVSWWPGDGNQMDATGRNPLIQPAQYFAYVTGKVDRAFDFLPSRIVASARSSDSLNFGSNANLSIEMWLRAGPTTPLPGNVPLLEKRTIGNLAGSDYAGQGYSLSLRDGRLAFWLSPNLAASNAAPFVSSGPDLRDGQYHHVGVSVERNATNGGKLFVDGKSVLTFDPVSRSGNLSNSSPLYLGWPMSLISNRVFVGQMDEPAIYNRALTEVEMEGIWLAGTNGKCKTPPFLALQPADRRVANGTFVTLSVVAGGWHELGYQWFRNGSAIPLATNWTCSFPAVSNYAGVYFVRVTNVFGSVMSSNAVISLNHPPVPVARLFTRFLVSSNDSDLRIIAPDGVATHVLFDASLSRDVDDDTLSFSWWEADATNAFATGVVATKHLPVGAYQLRLLVSDSYVTVANAFTLQVITAAAAVELLDERVAASDVPRGKLNALRAMLDSASRAFDAGHAAVGVHHLQTVQDRMRDWIAPLDEGLAAQWLWVTQQIIDVFEPAETVAAGPDRLEAHGLGRGKIHFYGAKGRPYLVEASGDLVNWRPMGVAVETGPGEFEFTDPAAGEAPQRFYRIKVP